MSGAAIPYQLAQPAGILPDLLLPGAMQLDDSLSSWIPQCEGVWFRPLLFGVSNGYYLNLLRVRAACMLSRHRHNGPVHAFTLRGSWRYLEHGWTAREGDYTFEPPGEVHTLIVPPQPYDMIALFHVSGGYVYVDPRGIATGHEDVFTKLACAREYFRQSGRDPTELDKLIR